MGKHQAKAPSGTILVADDVPENLQLLMKILKERNYIVRPAPDGEFALNFARSEPLDLILLDIKMPGMDGYAVCKQLKADERTRDIPVIFISALGEIHDKMRGFEAGGVDYITKPFRAEEILARVEVHLALREGTEELETLKQELRDFAYVVSHDLKTPLREIRRLVNCLAADYDDALDDEGKETKALLVQQVKRMDNLIDGILCYVKLGGLRGNQEQIDLSILVQEIIEMLAPPEHIHISIENTLPVIDCDRTHIKQVFQHLLTNAIAFMDKAQGMITIHPVDKGSYWQFCVADNGPGIDQKDREKHFKNFQTLSPCAEYDNTGIGLAIVRKIVKLHGGTVWVTSEAEQGSKFFFTLPKKH